MQNLQDNVGQDDHRKGSSSQKKCTVNNSGKSEIPLL